MFSAFKNCYLRRRRVRFFIRIQYRFQSCHLLLISLESFEIISTYNQRNSNRYTILVFWTSEMANSNSLWASMSTNIDRIVVGKSMLSTINMIATSLISISNFRSLVQQFYHILTFFWSCVPQYDFPLSICTNSASFSLFIDSWGLRRLFNHCGV